MGVDSGSCYPQLVPRDQWALPTTSVHRTLRDALADVFARVRAPDWLHDEHDTDSESLQPLSDHQLARWAPAPDWRRGLAGFADGLDQWRHRWRDSQSVTFLVAPPFSGVTAALEALAGDRQWRLIQPPPGGSIHRGEDLQAWWAQFEGDEPWVLPELGHCWLRTPGGLALVRRLLGAATGGSLGPGIVAASSWCWTFWNHLMPEMRVPVVTAQAFDSERLGQWLTTLESAARPRVHLTTDDSLVAAPDGEGESGFLRDLAAWSRGLPEVAWAVWRRALRARPEDKAGTADASGATGDGERCWVVPWSQLTLPALPPGESRPLAFVLHALLLHQGLDESTLQPVTGLGSDDIQLALHSLRRAELVEPHPRGWFVSAGGYPAVRRYLQSEGFAVDGF